MPRRRKPLDVKNNHLKSMNGMIILKKWAMASILTLQLEYGKGKPGYGVVQDADSIAVKRPIKTC